MIYDGIEINNIYNTLQSLRRQSVGNITQIIQILQVLNTTINTLPNNITSVINSVFDINIKNIIPNINPNQIKNITSDKFISQLTNTFVENLEQNIYNNYGIDINFSPLNYSATNILDFLNLVGLQDYLIKIPNLYTVLHNTSSPHACAVFTGQLISSTFYQCSAKENANYVTRNFPLPVTISQAIEIKILLSVFASLFILIPLCYIPASFIPFIIRERVSKSKHLQIVSSVSPYIYWLATYTWDMLLYFILTLSILGAFYVYGASASQVFIGTTRNTFAVFLLIWLYGASSIPLCYIYSFAFENHSTAQISIMTLNFITGFVFVLAYFIMNSIPQTQDAAKTAVLFFRIFPSYNIGEGLINISTTYFIGFLSNKPVDYFVWNAAGQNLVYMSLQMIGFLLIVLISESFIIRELYYRIDQFLSRLAGPPPPSKLQEDDDVIDENMKLHDVNPNSYALLLRNLIKTYPSPILCGKAKHAVRGITLGCQIGETFGLLGITFIIYNYIVYLYYINILYINIYIYF